MSEKDLSNVFSEGELLKVRMSDGSYTDLRITPDPDYRYAVVVLREDQLDLIAEAVVKKMREQIEFSDGTLIYWGGNVDRENAELEAVDNPEKWKELYGQVRGERDELRVQLADCKESLESIVYNPGVARRIARATLIAIWSDYIPPDPRIDDE